MANISNKICIAIFHFNREIVGETLQTVYRNIRRRANGGSIANISMGFLDDEYVAWR